jgi:AcrR family transcriptional regulator
MARGAINSNRKATPKGSAARARIVATARGHFFVHGFRRCTMDDLAAELGMSKKTLYGCFASKAALVQAVILAKFADVEAALEGISRHPAPDFLDSLQQLLTCIRTHTEEVRPPFLRDIQREAPELFELVQSRRRTLIQRHFKTLFERGRKAGLIRGDIPATLMTEILLGATQAVANPQTMLELDLTPQTALSAILRVVLEGVLTRPGRHHA